MTPQEYGKRLEALREVITRGLSYYAVWKMLRLRDADNVSWSLEEQNQILGRFRGFLSPVVFALLDMALMQFAKAFDTDRRTASLTNLLAAARRDTSLVPGVSVSDLRATSREISQHKRMLISLKRKRDQDLSHIDASPAPVDPLLTAEFDKLVESVKSAFNTLSTGHAQGFFSWDHMLSESQRHTTEVVQALLGQIERDRQKYDDEMVLIGLDEARRAEEMLGHRLDKETLGSAIGTFGLTKEQMQRIEKEYNSEATRSVSS